jgi:ubiquinol-cytochrome c reductase cytochrome b subunit
MFTGIYYGSYKKGREMIWVTGALLLATFSAEGFSGYMLPWGQMSFWAAQVITNLFAAISPELVIWIRGDYVVGDATLTRFFALHVLIIPLIIMGVLMAHMYALRIPHVNNQDGDEIDYEAEARKFKAGDKKNSKVMPFWPTFMAEDVFTLALFLVFFFYLVFYHFGFAMDPINFIPADSMKTPPHIYPEWYFLWSYEVLRGFFFSSDMGLLAFAAANAFPFVFPWLDRDTDHVAPMHKRPLMKYWFWAFIFIMIGLTVWGKLPPTGINAWIGFALSVAWLVLVFIFMPLFTTIEKKRREG